MSARDDFELVRQACSLASDHPAATTHYPAAFNRLFTPRPLRELVAEGFTRFQTWPDGTMFQLSGNIHGQYLFQTGVSSAAHLADWQDYPAIPIMTPEDMGVG